MCYKAETVNSIVIPMAHVAERGLDTLEREKALCLVIIQETDIAFDMRMYTEHPNSPVLIITSECNWFCCCSLWVDTFDGIAIVRIT